MEESCQDTPQSESVQAESVLKENVQTAKSPQHQRQRDYGVKGGNRGIKEHERGARGARKDRKEYDIERSEFGREREERGYERREYGRQRGGYGREREYDKGHSMYSRERGYRKPGQEEQQGTWRYEEGYRNNRSKFSDQRKPKDTSSEAQNKSAGNENGSTEKVEEHTVEAEQRIENENSERGSPVTRENQVEGDSAKTDQLQLQKVEEAESQRTIKNSRQNDSTFRGKEAPSKKSGNFGRRDRRQDYDRYEEGNRSNRSNKFYDQRKPKDNSSTASETKNKSAENGSTEKTERTVETEQRIENETSKCGSTVAQENQGDSADQLQKVEKAESQRTTKNSRQNESTFHGKEAPSRRSGNFATRDRRQDYDRRVEEEFPRRYLQKSQPSGERQRDIPSKGSDDRERSKYSTEMPNVSEQSVKETEMPQKEMAIDEKLQNASDIDVSSGYQGKSEPGSFNSNRKPSEHNNHNRRQRHHRRDQDQKQYHEDGSRSNSHKKDQLLKDKIADEGKDSGSGIANTHPEQPKDVACSRLCETEMPGLSRNDTSILHKNKTSAPRQSSKQENDSKPRLHARGNTVKARDMDDHYEHGAGTDVTSRGQLPKDLNSKPKTVTDQRTREYPGNPTIIQRNSKNPQRFEARQFNDRQKFRKDAKLEIVKDKNDLSESRPAQNDRPIYDEPRSSLEATSQSHSEKSSEVHPGFCIRSISTVDKELCKTLDS